MEANGKRSTPLNVLTLDGGGMRGLYTTTVLETLTHRFSAEGSRIVDLGEGFDVIVGTSTGAILASGLAAGVNVNEIARLYRDLGGQIFPDPMPDYCRSDRLSRRLKFVRWLCRHHSSPGSDGRALRSALIDVFGDETLGGLHERRNIGLCIVSTALHRHQPWVFKTPHLPSYTRDLRTTISDACLASAAAPIYLPLAEVSGQTTNGSHIFADGGLWANNPVMIGITEALLMAENDRPIRVLSLGTCPVPPGEVDRKLHRGLMDWRAGAGALELAMNAQSQAAQHQAEHLVRALKRRGIDIEVVRLKESPPSGSMARCIGLDRANEEAVQALINHGETDGTEAYRMVQQGTPEGNLINEIFTRMPRSSGDLTTTNSNRQP